MNQEATFEQCFSVSRRICGRQMPAARRTAGEFSLGGGGRMENETENDKWIFESYESK